MDTQKPIRIRRDAAPKGFSVARISRVDYLRCGQCCRAWVVKPNMLTAGGGLTLAWTRNLERHTLAHAAS